MLEGKIYRLTRVFKITPNPGNTKKEELAKLALKGLILSGGPASAYAKNAISKYGVFIGFLFPLATLSLYKEDNNLLHTGAVLETADHLGAAFGGIVTGLVFIPVFQYITAMGSIGLKL